MRNRPIPTARKRSLETHKVRKPSRQFRHRLVSSSRIVSFLQARQGVEFPSQLLSSDRCSGTLEPKRKASNFRSARQPKKQEQVANFRLGSRSSTVVSAIILWNTRYLERPVDVLRKFEDGPHSLPVHLSPLGWEHVNLTGDYVWGVEQSLSENIDGLRSLRTQADALQKAV